MGAVEAKEDEEVFGKLEFPETEVPHDDEGFCQSFTIDQEQEYLKFFKKYGFVVINKIVPQEECETLVSEIWDYFESRSWSFMDPKFRVDRNDSSTWDGQVLPVSYAGLVGNDVADMKTFWNIRQSLLMYRVFSKLYGKDKLWVSLDRVGAMRPTKGVPMGTLTPPTKFRYIAETDTQGVPIEDRPENKTKNKWLHWDLCPWVWTNSSEGNDYQFDDFIQENNGSRNVGDLKLQGVVSLVDSRVGDGGFCCVPGFHNHLSEYVSRSSNTIYANTVKNSYSFCSVHPNDCLNNQIKPISSRAGSLLVWNSELPHCNYPNDSNRWRFNVYVKMFPAQEGMTGTDFRKRCVEDLTKDVEVTELGKKLFGLENY